MKDTQVFRDVLPPEQFGTLRRWLAGPGGAAVAASGQSEWFALGSQAHPVQRAALALRPLVNAEVAWVEWWVRRRPRGEGQALHYDKDERRLREQGKRLHPRMASVFTIDDAGGATVVYDLSIRRLQEGWVPTSQPVTHIHPSPNQFLLFPGDRLHGVAAGVGEGDRLSLLLNWWDTAPTD